MGDDLGDGIYVEESVQGRRRIEGVPTSIAGFVGHTPTGPTGVSAEPICSLAEYESLYGGAEPLKVGDACQLNFMWHAAWAFFGEGGQRLYVSRVEPGREAEGLKALEEVEAVSVVAAPGATGEETCISLVEHAEAMRHRIALLDTGVGNTPDQALALRESANSSHAALYYPWVKVLDPALGGETLLPPSGFVAGVYARNDSERGVSKAPSNLAVKLAVGLERAIGKPVQDELNQQGVNTLRHFEGRGIRVWGARTAGSGLEWKFVNMRRYFAYLERSIERGTQWVVFEPNGEDLWANVRRIVEDFLYTEWQSGALLGNRPELAFVVKCDRTTMTQDDLDNGRLVCLIGVAALRPAEFVIFRIGQWTADSSRDSE